MKPFETKAYSERGADTGRPTIVPDDYTGEKLHLQKVPLDSGGYDPGGAYWGVGPPALYCAYGESKTEQLQVFFRSNSRETAKRAIRNLIYIRCDSFLTFLR
jgi:hypothetical protein